MQISFDENFSSKKPKEQKKEGDIKWFGPEVGAVRRFSLLSNEPFVNYNYYIDMKGDGLGNYKALGSFSGTEFVVDPLVKKLLGDPKPRFALPVLVYDTDDEGDIKTPFSYEVCAWIFPLAKYYELKDMKRTVLKQHKGKNFSDFDYAITSSSFKDSKIHFLGDAVWRQSDKVIADAEAQAAELSDKLPRLIGKGASKDEWDAFLRKGFPDEFKGEVEAEAAKKASKPAPTKQSPVDIDDLLDS